MFEEIVYPTTPGHGDMMGWSWSGTAHASTSTRTAGRVRISTDYLNVAEGTIAAVIKTKISSADFGSELPTIFEEDTGELRFLYNGTITDWTFTDGTNTATSSDETFDVNETIVLHVTWGADGLFIYKNGSQIATNATYTPFTMGPYVYIGTSDSPGRHNNATMLDFRSYATAATAAEVLADYTNIAAIIADGERVGNIPWLWTNDGKTLLMHVKMQAVLISFIAVVFLVAFRQKQI